MCAIMGACLTAPTKKQLEILKQVFIESQIRGRHATGISVLTEEGVETTVKPVPAEEFVKTLDLTQFRGVADFKLIGHCRYSTSDLRYNQPLRTSNVAVVHNGVITQDPPELWDRYGYELETSNDSELLLRAVVNGEEPLVRFPDASVAALELHKGGKMRWYRNGKRPLYTTKVENGYFVTSTKDIALRAGLVNPSRAKPGVVYTPDGFTIIKSTKELIHV